MSTRYKLNSLLDKLERRYEVFNEITLSQSALLNNIDLLAELSPKHTIIPVLKSNAYGHGLIEIAKILNKRDMPYIAVDGYYEALQVAEVSKHRVLVMGAIKQSNYKRIKTKNMAFVVHDYDSINSLGGLKKPINIHLEIDTGMARHGINPNELDDYLKVIRSYKNLELDGVMSHLADADNPSDNTFTKRQAKLFDTTVEAILKKGFKPKYIHIAQSAGVTKVQSRFANASRVGIALYGFSPLSENDPMYTKLANLRPVLELHSTVTKISEVDSGTTVGYGRTFTSNKVQRIGVLPIGYYEGIPVELSNVGQVSIGGKNYTIAGRVCMNITMINLEDSTARVGDDVMIISSDKKSPLSVETICKSNNLFIYDFVVSLNQNIRRRIV